MKATFVLLTIRWRPDWILVLPRIRFLELWRIQQVVLGVVAGREFSPSGSLAVQPDHRRNRAGILVRPDCAPKVIVAAQFAAWRDAEDLERVDSALRRKRMGPGASRPPTWREP